MPAEPLVTDLVGAPDSCYCAAIVEMHQPCGWCAERQGALMPADSTNPQPEDAVAAVALVLNGGGRHFVAALYPDARDVLASLAAAGYRLVPATPLPAPSEVHDAENTAEWYSLLVSDNWDVAAFLDADGTPHVQMGGDPPLSLSKSRELRARLEAAEQWATERADAHNHARQEDRTDGR